MDPPGSIRAQRRQKPPQLSAACLIALTFFSVTGGPFGQELIVRAGGPLLALGGLALFTLLWSVPEAIMTAELSAAYPEAAGFAAWVNAAFGPFAAWIDSWCSWSSGVIDNAVYPILFLSYLEARAHTDRAAPARAPSTAQTQLHTMERAELTPDSGARHSSPPKCTDHTRRAALCRTRAVARIRAPPHSTVPTSRRFPPSVGRPRPLASWLASLPKRRSPATARGARSRAARS